MPQRYKKNHKKKWTVVCQQIAQPRRNGQIFRNIQRAKSNQEEIDNLNRLITSSEIEFVIFFKVSRKQKFRIRWLHRGILPNM